MHRPVVAMLNDPAVVTARREVDHQLLARLWSLFGGSDRRTPGMSWAALLFPTIVEPGLELPDRVWEVFRHVEWTGPLTPGPLELTAASTYRSAHDDSTEVGLRTTAVAADGTEAHAFSVLRLGGVSDLGEGWGDRTLPSRPEAPTTSRGSTLVFDKPSIVDYLEIVELHHPLVDSGVSAHHLGLPNRLVPSGLLAASALRGHRSPAGAIDLWFRAPVPEGCLVNVGEADDADGAVAGLLTLPAGRAAAQYRYRSAS